MTRIHSILTRRSSSRVMISKSDGLLSHLGSGESQAGDQWWTENSKVYADDSEGASLLR